MSLVRFYAKNHPQQVTVRGADGHVDDRWTPPEVFDPLHARFGFTLDAAASEHNHKCPKYFTYEQNGLAQSWAGERVWVNPPYSDIRPWVEKAWAEVRGKCEVVVMLVPANRTEQRWWQDLIEPTRDKGRGLAVEFLPGRMRFKRPDWIPGPKGDRPPFGCCLLIFTRMA